MVVTTDSLGCWLLCWLYTTMLQLCCSYAAMLQLCCNYTNYATYATYALSDNCIVVTLLVVICIYDRYTGRFVVEWWV